MFLSLDNMCSFSFESCHESFLQILARGQQDIVTIQALLVHRRPLEFSDMTVKTLCHCGPVCATCHVFVPCGAVAIHTLQSLSSVITVIELDDLFFDDVV